MPRKCEYIPLRAKNTEGNGEQTLSNAVKNIWQWISPRWSYQIWCCITKLKKCSHFFTFVENWSPYYVAIPHLWNIQSNIHQSLNWSQFVRFNLIELTFRILLKLEKCQHKTDINYIHFINNQRSRYRNACIKRV